MVLRHLPDPAAPTSFQAFQTLNQNLGGNSGLNYWYNTSIGYWDPSIVRDCGAACTFANIELCSRGTHDGLRRTAPPWSVGPLRRRKESTLTPRSCKFSKGGPPAATLWQNSTLLHGDLCDLVTPVHDVYSLTVATGDTIDFVVGEAGAGNHAGTRLDATITPTPEPGTVVLLLTGLFGLLAYAWRKRR